MALFTFVVALYVCAAAAQVQHAEYCEAKGSCQFVQPGNTFIIRVCSVSLLHDLSFVLVHMASAYRIGLLYTCPNRIGPLYIHRIPIGLANSSDGGRYIRVGEDNSIHDIHQEEILILAANQPYGT